MQLRLSASGRTAQQPKSYCTTLPCSKAQAQYLSQNIGIVTNCKTTHAKKTTVLVLAALHMQRACLDLLTFAPQPRLPAHLELGVQQALALTQKGKGEGVACDRGGPHIMSIGMRQGR